MRREDLRGLNVVIWGTGREGQAAAELLGNDAAVTLVDENGRSRDGVVTDPAQIAIALNEADAVIKSPGVSLYHPLVKQLREKGIPVTSLLNLWLAEPRRSTVICVTGTKGKSTTSSLLAHVLRALGKRVALAGNIGVAISTVAPDDHDIVIIETSSFQAADLQESCDLAVLTSLYEDHIDWHGSRASYHTDKLNLLRRAGKAIVSAQARDLIGGIEGAIIVESESSPDPGNNYLRRPHNLSNVRTVLAVIRELGLDESAALTAMADFKGLPHRQQELGEKNGVLYVNDSISTTASSAIAALNTYADRPVILIAGGFDRGIDYAPLAERLKDSSVKAIVLLGPSGERLGHLLDGWGLLLENAATMEAAVTAAERLSKPGSVVLLSPGAPSFGLFRDYVERGETFARLTGFAA